MVGSIHMIASYSIFRYGIFPSMLPTYPIDQMLFDTIGFEANCAPNDLSMATTRAMTRTVQVALGADAIKKSR